MGLSWRRVAMGVVWGSQSPKVVWFASHRFGALGWYFPYLAADAFFPIYAEYEAGTQRWIPQEVRNAGRVYQVPSIRDTSPGGGPVSRLEEALTRTLSPPDTSIRMLFESPAEHRLKKLHRVAIKTGTVRGETLHSCLSSSCSGVTGQRCIGTRLSKERREMERGGGAGARVEGFTNGAGRPIQ